MSSGEQSTFTEFQKSSKPLDGHNTSVRLAGWADQLCCIRSSDNDGQVGKNVKNYCGSVKSFIYKSRTKH